MQQTPSFNINSKHYIDRLENDIVQLAKVLSVEHAIDIENAKLMARQIMQRRLNSLLTEEEKNGIKRVSNSVKEDIKNYGFTAGRILDVKDVYELLKTFDLL